MKKYWFYLEPYIYVEFKAGLILMYCTKTGVYTEIESIQCKSIIEEIYKDENLGVVELSEDQVQNTQVREMIDFLAIHGMGHLDPVIDSEERPVILLPLLSLNKDLERIKDDEMIEMMSGTDICKYLLGVSIVVNNECVQRCSHCGHSCKQFTCCSTDENTVKELDEKMLVSILGQLSYLPTKTINILGGDIYRYSHLKLFSSVTEKKILNIWTNYKNYQTNLTIDQCRLHILVDFPVDLYIFEKVVCNAKDLNVTFHFIVEDETQLEDCISKVSHFQIGEYEIHPYYNGANIGFFDRNVFMDKIDIFSSIHSMREIFRNKKLNANYFGELYIFPDGEVRAEVNSKSLGNVKDANLKTFIQQELIENTAWRKTRTFPECINCLCQNLCPSPMNYEIVTNKNCCGKKIKDTESLLLNFKN